MSDLCKKKLNVTIGVLAYNEERNIERTLSSLLGQSCFIGLVNKHIEISWNILIVPNGCSDNTAKIATSFLQSAIKSLSNMDYQVHSIPESGKSNAWNVLVHDLISVESDVTIMMDADIEFADEFVVEKCIIELQSNHKVHVVTDTPVKIFKNLGPLSVFGLISKRLSRAYPPSSVDICGQFYCARTEMLKKITMPRGLPVEDGFLAFMVIRRAFTTSSDHSLVKVLEGANHYFDGLDSIDKLFKHEVRLVIGTTLNCYLCWDVLNYFIAPNGDGAGKLINDLNQTKPNWFIEYVSNQVKIRGFWVLPHSMLFRRLDMLKSKTLFKSLIYLPVVIPVFIFDLMVQFSANRKLKQGKSVGYW